MDVVNLGVFSPSVLLAVAQSTGRLDAAGVQVHQVPVPSSPAQFASLRDGAYDAVFTSPDNVLAYRILPDNPLGEMLDVEIVAGVDRGLGLCLSGRPGRTDLSGAVLGVDVPTSGFAFVAYALLAEMGVAREDVEIVALGSTPTRVAALVDGRCDITVLNAGNEIRARADGCVELVDVTSLGPYLGTVVARLRQAPGGDAVDRLVAALGDTAAAIVAGALTEDAEEAAARLLTLTPEGAAEHVAVLRDPARGLIVDGSVEVAALDTLVRLRGRFLPAPQLDGLADRFDEVVRHCALST
ncbi:hypothetical protein [Mycobacterium sp. PSTR-4-N]|uniref:ABC transporter substrate-binding protein n=1 Tax=Mycobacterium sp. PSTR-4-N TaxID=2917745 RepID=UPI001F151D89|nr:hypothetical protein [Mycobacterium sp. PSTR-4-N]MCG7593245.1 hypothetical protein [Mycobacterium sp. PSTR-4-N]